MSVQFNFQNRVIAVTGAASGIGLETARLLASSGATLSLADVQKEALDSVVAELTGLGAQVVGHIVDVSQAQQVDEWISQTVATFGKLDGAANLAGVIGKDINKHTTAELSEDDWAFVTGVNLTGVMHCMRAQINAMKDDGSIVNTSSVAGSMGFPKNASYTAAKHGVIGLTRTAAKEVGIRGIRVNAVSPGLIDTPMQAKSVAMRGADRDWTFAIKRMGKPAEVAQLVAWLLSDSTGYISGTVQSIDGGWAC
ncbi:hypothetical protein FE257_011082 [Aspergillus nanangensis]|uniref:Ketoreductase domain-containing protein n=1 Tax=Aspergillus nanangensis TaxID=2582783 RepID=A0AAD4CHZ6_ASPNN|nr:hypothetical protein FE257_011082 [Aspergillus nanangensis]